MVVRYDHDYRDPQGRVPLYLYDYHEDSFDRMGFYIHPGLNAGNVLMQNDA